MKSRCRKLILLLLIALCHAALSPGISAQELQVRFEEQLVIGGQEDAPIEYLFGGPDMIATDSAYRIYVATRDRSIRVFSPEGEYLKTIGRSGKGPGEFLAISSMTIGHNDELIVQDGQMQRVTWFYQMGDSIETRSMPSPYWVGDRLVPVAAEQYASVAIEPSSVREYLVKYVDIDFENVNDGDNILYLLNEDLSERSAGLFDVYEHMPFDPENRLEARFAESGFNLAALNENTVIITNRISNGSMYLVDIHGGNVREVTGFFSGRESYEELDWDRRRSYPGKLAGLITAGGTTQAVYQIKVRSRILLSNGNMGLNFIQTAEGNETENYLEYIDRNGNYLGFSQIDDYFTIMQMGRSFFSDVELMQQQFYPKHLDDRNQLYYVDYSSGIPVIRVTKIVLGKE